MSYGRVEYDELLDQFKCEVCGKKFGALSRHVYQKHGITIREYKTRFGLSQNTPLITEKEMEKHAERARNSAMIKRFRHDNTHKFKKGDNSRQSYERSSELKHFIATTLSKAGHKRRRELAKLRKLTSVTKSDKM